MWYKIASIMSSFAKWKLIWICRLQNHLTVGHQPVVISNGGSLDLDVDFENAVCDGNVVGLLCRVVQSNVEWRR